MAKTNNININRIKTGFYSVMEELRGLEKEFLSVFCSVMAAQTGKTGQSFFSRDANEIKARMEEINKGLGEKLAELNEKRASNSCPDQNVKSEILRVNMEMAKVSSNLEKLERIEREYQDLETLSELLDEQLRETGQIDTELEAEFDERSSSFREEIEHERMLSLLSGEYDSSNAILMVHAGSGGLDSQDWTGMLLRMYLRYAEREGLKAETLEATSDEGEGIKTATVLVSGPNAYGLLKAESGVHRLVRISPFDAAKRRHTSFASVSVSPEIPESAKSEIEIRPEDLKIDTFRASGAGGQYVNRTDSAVRITHLPSGMVVTCQNERSQHMNRETAMRVLVSRLYEQAIRQRQEKIANVVGTKKESTWGSQIRSYVLHPYTMVKDHRTNYETGNVQSVLDGNLNGFIMSYLSYLRLNAGNGRDKN